MDLYWLNANSSYITREELSQHRIILIPHIVITSVSCIGGTIGNILTILAFIFDKVPNGRESAQYFSASAFVHVHNQTRVWKNTTKCENTNGKRLQSSTNIFLVNMAIIDLTISSFVNIFSIVGALEGESFFMHQRPLCILIGFVCICSCFLSLLSIMMVAVNRYFFICQTNIYQDLFTKRKSFLMCGLMYVYVFLLEMVNFMPWGNHLFDRKTLSCLWDRTSSLGVTVFLMTLGIVIPLIMTTICYILIFQHFYMVKKRLKQNNQNWKMRNKFKESKRLAVTLLFIFIMFSVCWLPYGLVTISDIHNVFPPLVHLYSVTIAHLNSSINPLVYIITNQKFRVAYKNIFTQCYFIKKRKISPSVCETNKVFTTKL